MEKLKRWWWCFAKSPFFQTSACSGQYCNDISKIKRVLVLKGICSETTYYIPNFRNLKKHVPTSKRTPKKHTQIKVKQVFQLILLLILPFCHFAVSVSGFVIFVDQQYLDFKTIERFSSVYFNIVIVQ